VLSAWLCASHHCLLLLQIEALTVFCFMCLYFVFFALWSPSEADSMWCWSGILLDIFYTVHIPIKTYLGWDTFATWSGLLCCEPEPPMPQQPEQPAADSFELKSVSFAPSVTGRSSDKSYGSVDLQERAPKETAPCDEEQPPPDATSAQQDSPKSSRYRLLKTQIARSPVPKPRPWQAPRGSRVPRGDDNEL